MGISMGYTVENCYNLSRHPEVTPHPLEEPTNDPLTGFSKGRKVRTIKATEDEIYSAKIPLDDRDYCVDYLLDFQSCRYRKWPWPVFCAHEKHAYLDCRMEDFVIRMKEYEREKRLLKYGVIKKKESSSEK